MVKANHKVYDSLEPALSAFMMRWYTQKVYVKFDYSGTFQPPHYLITEGR